MTFPGADTIKAGIIGLDFFLSIFFLCDFFLLRLMRAAIQI